jgi:2,3-bisphosphoglycerate-dependent phosphoglycerate mutase
MGEYAMSIFLVRHGETASNAARVIQTPDAPLSARGILQAERLALRLGHLGVAAIVSSDYARAHTTAESIRRATGASVEYRPDLRERSFGALRGRPYAECPVDIFAPGFAPPGGETWHEFHARVERAWRLVVAHAAETGGNLAVVTHGLVCASIVQRLVGLGDHVPPAWANACLTILSSQPPHALELLACTQHLADLAASAGRDGGAA